MSEMSEPDARDYLAQERTLLAWIRTGVGLIGLGFVVARFGVLLSAMGMRAPSPAESLVDLVFVPERPRREEPR